MAKEITQKIQIHKYLPYYVFISRKLANPWTMTFVDDFVAETNHGQKSAKEESETEDVEKKRP